MPDGLPAASLLLHPPDGCARWCVALAVGTISALRSGGGPHWRFGGGAGGSVLCAAVRTRHCWTRAGGGGAVEGIAAGGGVCVLGGVLIGESCAHLNYSPTTTSFPPLNTRGAQ
eukprot:1160396-Pelagomonas_calceolata.AAC.23